ANLEPTADCVSRSSHLVGTQIEDEKRLTLGIDALDAQSRVGIWKGLSSLRAILNGDCPSPTKEEGTRRLNSLRALAARPPCRRRPISHIPPGRPYPLPRGRQAQWGLASGALTWQPLGPINTEII